MSSYRYNTMELQSEILAALLRIERTKKKGTVGEVGRNLINIRPAEAQLKQALRDLWDWGILDRQQFQYRKNVVATEFQISPAAMPLVIQMIKFSHDLAPHFANRKEFKVDM